MWGYAEGNQTALTVVVVVIVGAALAYVIGRFFTRRGR
jgi:membrane protein DedA with SNARE-associated domain